MKSNNVKQPKLDKEEQELLAAYEKGVFKLVLTPTRKQAILAAAEQTFIKGKRINIPLSGRDLAALQEGIPYQTLVSSVLHKYVSGG
jgi:predicted DNA binding CopG/RHH family protein